MCGHLTLAGVRDTKIEQPDGPHARTNPLASRPPIPPSKHILTQPPLHVRRGASQFSEPAKLPGRALGERRRLRLLILEPTPHHPLDSKCDLKEHEDDQHRPLGHKSVPVQVFSSLVLLRIVECFEVVAKSPVLVSFHLRMTLMSPYEVHVDVAKSGTVKVRRLQTVEPLVCRHLPECRTSTVCRDSSQHERNGMMNESERERGVL
jgi:hypothetical protein